MAICSIFKSLLVTVNKKVTITVSRTVIFQLQLQLTKITLWYLARTTSSVRYKGTVCTRGALPGIRSAAAAGQRRHGLPGLSSRDGKGTRGRVDGGRWPRSRPVL